MVRQSKSNDTSEPSHADRLHRDLRPGKEFEYGVPGTISNRHGSSSLVLLALADPVGKRVGREGFVQEQALGLAPDDEQGVPPVLALR